MLRCAKRAREHHVEGVKPVAFEIGGTAASYERFRIMKGGRNKKFQDVYVHVQHPLKTQQDHAALAQLKCAPDWPRYNHVPTSGHVHRDTINYCHHDLLECDCLKFYTEGHRHAFCIHSADALNELHYNHIFKYLPFFEGVVSMAEVGEYPVDNPTIRVSRLSEAGDIFGRVSDRARRLFTGLGCLLHEPLGANRVHEVHPEFLPYVAAGGYHSYPVNEAFERYAHSPASAIKAGFCIFGSASVAFWASARGLPTSIRLGVSALAGVNALLMSGLYAVFMQRLKRARIPLCIATATTHIDIQQSYGETGLPPSSAIFRATRTPPEALRPAAIGRRVVEVAEVGRVAAAITMCKDRVKATKQVAAQLLRAQVPVSKVRGVLDQAAHAVRFLNLDPPDPPRPPWYRKLALGAICLPPALVVTLTGYSLLDVLCELFPSNPCVRALLLLNSTPWSAIAALCLFFLGAFYITTIGLRAVLALSALE
jgi:hypothetical protein